MKKLLFVLALLILAVPAMAAVTVSCNLDGANTIAVKCAVTSPDVKVRAFGLNISVDSGQTITGVTYTHPAYRIYPGNIDINSSGGIVGFGSPVAPSGDPGALGGIGTSGITIEMASLYGPNEPNMVGDPNVPPAVGSGAFTLLKFTVSGSCVTTVTANAIRGGVVKEDVTVASIGTSTCSSTPCMQNVGDAEYLKWVDYGLPACWCFRKQCRGDADGVKTFLKPVMGNDLTIWKAAFNKSKADVKALLVTVPGVTNPVPGICADFDHVDTFLKPVMGSDLTIWKGYFNDADAAVPQCDAAPVITGPYNYWTN